MKATQNKVNQRKSSETAKYSKLSTANVGHALFHQPSLDALLWLYARAVLTSSLIIMNGGLFDVKRHLASTKHAQMVDIKNSQQIFYFNVPSENEGLTADVRAVITEALFSCWLVIKSHWDLQWLVSLFLFYWLMTDICVYELLKTVYFICKFYHISVR